MTANERVMEAAKLRLRLRMNSRLRLESMAVLSRLFREHDETISDELLSSLVLAVPEELIGEAAHVRGAYSAALNNPPDRGRPPGNAADLTKRSRGHGKTKPPPRKPRKNPPPRPPRPKKKGEVETIDNVRNPPGRPPTGEPPGV